MNDTPEHPFFSRRSRPLWAPWRIRYIKGEKPDGCFLCNAVNNPDDTETRIITRGKHCFIVMNHYPYNAGHVMVCPNRHVADLDELTDEETMELMSMIVKIKKVCTEVMSPEGFNCGFNLGSASGAGLQEHLHGHLVPRWWGDTNFMPVLSDNRVIPEALEETAVLLRKTWNELFEN